MNEAFLGLGTNIGKREENLSAALELLVSKMGINIIKQSSVLETKPVGYTEQPDFLNMVIKIETKLSPEDLLKVCLSVENELKRERLIRWGPRTIDIDVLLYNDTVINSPDLEVPHPRMHERVFVLAPLCEIEPTIIHPILMKTASELLDKINKNKLE